MRAGLDLRALLAAAALLSACSNGSEPSGGPGLNILSGAGTSDTIDAELRAPLVIRMLDDVGKPVAGEHLVLESRDCPIYYIPCSVYVGAVSDSFWSSRHLDSTDADGYARFRIKFGTQAGEARLRITALDSLSSIAQVVAATWTVAPGRVAAIMPTPRDTALYVDGSYVAVATTYDRGLNPRGGDPVSFARVDGPIEVTGGSVRATGIGRARLVARTGAVVDTAWVSVVPGGRLALSTYGGSDVHTVQLDGSELTRIASSPDYDSGRPAWVGAGPSLVFVQDTAGSGGLLRVSDGSGASHRLAPSSTATQEQSPRVSRDGLWTYFQYIGPPATGIELWRVHLDGTGLERIGAAGDPDHADLEPDPSPDGTRLAYGTSRPDGVWHVIVRDLATGTDHSLGVTGRLPRWSPAGDRIAYWNTPDGYTGTIHVVQPDGSGDRLVSAPGVGYADAGLDWSPDGAWLVARSEHTIDLIDVATGQTLPLPWSGAYAWPAWRPE